MENNKVRDKQTDLFKLADAYFDNIGIYETFRYKYIGVDCKLPFGSSDVEGDILNIIGWKEECSDEEDPCFSQSQRRYAEKLYKIDLIYFLKEQWKYMEINTYFEEIINRLGPFFKHLHFNGTCEYGYVGTLEENIDKIPIVNFLKDIWVSHKFLYKQERCN